MLKESVEAALNAQINKELASAYLYMSMAAHFQAVNLPGFAHWMELQTQEELTHTRRLYDYVIQKGGVIKLSALDAPQQAWDSPMAVMTEAYEHECMISERINAVVSEAMKVNDHATVAALQWFVTEQVEEEAAAYEIVQKLKLVDDNSTGLFMMDTELARRTLSPDTGA